MSCPNFKRMKFDMPMVCSKTYAQMEKMYGTESDEEFDDNLYYLYQEDEYYNAANMAEEFNETLIFHDVEVISGHYDGFQFYVTEKYENIFDLDKSSKYCIDNEDARYYFDMFRSQALIKAEAEKRKIRKWLNSLTDSGFNIVVCVGIFSNGEAVYHIV